MMSSGILLRAGLVRTDFPKERRASIIRVTRISEIGTALAATSPHSIASQHVLSW
jgi:hypothetical protein